MKIKQIVKISIFSLCAFFILATKIYAANSEWKTSTENNKGGKVRIISSFYNDDQQQKKLLLGAHFNLEKGWHIYSNEAGGFGMPPSLDFAGSTNYSKHQISWPKSILKEEKIGTETIKYGSYENEIILPVEISLQDITKPTQLKLKINYGLCKDICIPASTEFSLNIKDEQDEEALNLIQKFFDKKITFSKIENADKADKSSSDAAEQKMPSPATALLTALFAAILGGLILNIMPCVLPVLGIKLMSIIKHKESSISHIRLAFFSTILGIISCFTVFAVFAIIIKLTGNIFNWGLQFQNPYFLIFLIIVLLGFVANMIGLFEVNFNYALTNLLNKKISQQEADKKNIFMPNFLSGILAVLLATPCSAPFLGSAISFSITQDSSIIFLIFLAMGLGLAIPYIVLIISPKMVYLLPKPGKWMSRIKQIMAGLLVATVIWLIYVLSNNIGFAAGLIAALASALFFACFKIRIKLLKIIALLAVIITIIILPATFKAAQKPMHPADMMWIKFDEEDLRKRVAAGQTVVVDVTADWCITCKFNKLRVFHDEEVMQKLSRDNIITMRADITKPDQAALDFIHKKGRYAIPFDAVYGPNASDGLLANELLTKTELFELIDKASQTQN